MQTKTITLYDYSELSPKAKEKALSNWNENNYDPMMQSDMINRLKEELEERGIKYDTDSIDVRYSLSYSQGDGFMYIGKIEWEGETVTVTHSNAHYCHMYTASIDTGELKSEDVDSFKAMYEEVCRKMEEVGYNEIEYQQSEEYFMEACDANEYTFREDGTMENL